MTVDFVQQAPSATDDPFEFYWNQQGEWVEEPNQRRGGESGVQRIHDADGRLLYVKRQVGHTYRSWRYPLGRPTVLREQDALLALSRLAVGVPELVYCGAQQAPDKQWRALLVTVGLEGFVEIDNWYAAGERERHGEAVHDRVLEAIGQTLARMHLGRWQHGCLYAKHVFVRVTGQGVGAVIDVALLDLEKSRQRLTAQKAASHDLKQLRRHSSWSATEWDRLIYFYKTVFGSAIKGLR
ncbi:lipopolysaccharide kinase InaA family protein [Pseudomonas fragi]|uniref:InaA protein n=1 Tax=Pseudomonas fragi TaxID=296 RepID=A0A9Q6VLP5_PSEFR|nr:lipopolysaccharide kinase InaA family protein [Pseudomonas fragi]QPL30697.1 InaA protein [Pseudomonas fragi]